MTWISAWLTPFCICLAHRGSLTAALAGLFARQFLADRQKRRLRNEHGHLPGQAERLQRDARENDGRVAPPQNARVDERLLTLQRERGFGDP